MHLTFDDGYSATTAAFGTAASQNLPDRLAEGRSRLSLGDFGGADAALSAYLQVDPHHAEARVLRADARFGLGCFQDAETDYTQVIGGSAGGAAHGRGAAPDAPSAPPAPPPALINHARTGLAHVLCRSMAPHSLEVAQAQLLAIEQSDADAPPSTWAQLAQARVAFESGDITQAQRLTSRLLQQHRNDARVWLALAEICDARGQTLEAATAADGACGISPSDAADAMTATLQLLRSGVHHAAPELSNALTHLYARSGALGFQIVVAKLAATDLTPAAQLTLHKAAQAVTRSQTGPAQSATASGAEASGPRIGAQAVTQNLSDTTPQLMTTAEPAALSACAIAAFRMRGPQWQAKFEASLDLLVQRCGPLGFWTLITKAEQAVDTPGRVAQLLEAAAAINPNDRYTHMLWLRVQARLGAVDHDLYQEVVTSRPAQAPGTRVFVLETEVELAKQRGDYPAAIHALDSLCSIAQEPRYYALRASFKLAEGYAASDVTADCNRALNFDGLHYLALYTRAQQDVRSRAFGSAEKTLQLCLAKHPDQPDPLYVLGEIAVSRGASVDAITHYKAYLDGSFPVGRQYDSEARLALAQAQLNTRDYAGAVNTLVRIDEAHPLHTEALALRTKVAQMQTLEQRGVLPMASLADIEALIQAKAYDKALATLHHHGPENARNVYALGLRALVHFELGNFAQAEADAQMAQDIAILDSLHEPVSARVLRESRAKNSSIFRMISEGVMATTRYFST